MNFTYFEAALNNKADLTNKPKIVVFSDLHFGVGDNKDNSLQNSLVLFEALKYYLANDYHLVLLGDTFELAENTIIDDIKNTHDNFMWIFTEFHNKNDLTIVRGNHDAVLSGRLVQRRPDRRFKMDIPFLQNAIIYDSCIIKNEDKDILMFHGHQNKWQYCTWFNKVINGLLRWGYSFLEFAFWKDPTREAIGNTSASKSDADYKAYATAKNAIVICGHTHSMHFHPGVYFNTGAGVMPRCATCIEIDTLKITPYKWSIECKDSTLKVKRTALL